MKKIEPSILFEDNHLLVVIKPKNIPTQGDSSHDVDMLTILKNYLKEKYKKPGDAFVGLVHRLDRPTGGVMVFAKTSKAASRLCTQITEGIFEKKYLAVLRGIPKSKRGKLVNYLLKDEANNMVKLVPLSTDGAKRAELDYVNLEENGEMSLVSINLITGRGHQARVQMAAMGCPIYGDAKYGKEDAIMSENLALWAYNLKFKHPISGQIMVFKVFPETEKLPWNMFSIEKHLNISKPN